jgi:N-acetylmuramoyl-L-alanine amidase
MGRAARCGVVLAASASSFSPGIYASSRTLPHAPRATPWEQAELAREELEATPPETRTRADYTAAMDRFRAVYHVSPRDVHAAASVYAVAELLAEEGRTTHDMKILKGSVGQYEFLRKQYPGSSLRVAALLAEAQIAANDLGDEAAARERYTLLLKQYPHSEQAEEARAGLEDIEGGRAHRAASGASLALAPPQTPQQILSRTGGAAFGPSPTPHEALTPPTATLDGPGERGVSHIDDTVSDAADADAAIPSPLDGNAVPAPPHKPAHRAATAKAAKGPLAQVKGIRHWSTPTYTRVAIDLGDDVTFEAARVPNPDRIYFDLHGTRLAQELVGKSFAVTDDGFLKRIRAAQFSDNMTRVVLDVNDVTEYSAFLLPNPYRLIIDIHGGSRTTAPVPMPAPQQPAGARAPEERVASSSLPSTPLTSGRPALTVPNTVAVRSTNSAEVASLSQQPGKVEATTRPTSLPISAVVAERPRPTPAIDSPPTSAAPANARKSKTRPADSIASNDALPARAAVPTADGGTSLVRALGLKIGRIVIDAGHGGHDSGTIGAGGIEEKDVVLDVALRLGTLLHDRLGAEIVYTRSDDTFVPLETRTAIANKAQADLFISIHANSSADSSARGVETYYLNFTTSPDALQTAARENAVSNQSIHQLSDLVKKITLRDKIDESREFASDVEDGLYSGLQKGNAGLKNRGVKKAPFVVLIGANMPSILAEISFVTNPRDASQLERPEYRQRVAESLYKGVARYEAGLSGTKPQTGNQTGNQTVSQNSRQTPHQTLRASVGTN